MKFKVEIECDNAAFDDVGAWELSSVLRELADKVGSAAFPAAGEFTVRDSNGNKVGKARYIGKRPS